MAQKPPAKKTVAEDPRYTQALQSYEAGLRAMQEHKFDKAKPHFQKIVAGTVKELADRASMHLNICNQHLERTTATQFKTSEEHFDYAVSLMNVGDYVSAREHLEKLLKQNAKADYVIYGLAALDCLTGHIEDSLRRLDEALRLNAALRFQATTAWAKKSPSKPSTEESIGSQSRRVRHSAAGRPRGRSARGRFWWRHRSLHAAERPEAIRSHAK
jgi:tetratricopeptide (TPR) repeat protein